MRRRESGLQQFWRYRGVVAVACVVLLLFLVIFRSSSNSTSAPVRVTQTQTTIDKASSPQLCYAVVFDAGSTGSRVHVYEFQSGENGQFMLRDELFEQLKPGLSSYAGRPEEAAQSLKPLLDQAIERVPSSQRASTQIVLKATAGLRMLEGSQAQDILDAVTLLIQSTPFQVPTDAIEIMEGQDEGAFAWLTLNYLLGTLDGISTVAAIDLGGGSVQQAYQIEDTDAKVPEGYIKVVSYGKHKFSVYVHSYLNYGLMAGRAEVLKASNNEGSNCLLEGVKGTYKYNNQEYTLKSKGSSFGKCSDNVESVLNKDGAICAFDKCTFAGAWEGNMPPSTDTYISSYFFDRAIDAGIIKDDKLSTADIKVKDFKIKGEIACSGKMDAFPNLDSELVHYLCLDLAYCYTLLNEGFNMDDNADISLVKKINYSGMEIEAAWPLGVALGMLGSKDQ
eukprot:TRINITY_DN5395_c1_g2_i1.p1 TRINITY_DN5395_c1_g2~~TRINITY_DN5395_c1_g2_i1.p1  ORF type:complete len:501 (-),score=43.69 TRINITY_DN5395_c1_g2_i1:470-1816(-)